jgi:hypothetical protein
VVDDQLGRRQRVDLCGVTAQFDHRLAHRGEVDDARHTGEVLHDDAGGRELDLRVGLGARVPAGQRPDVVGRDVGAVFGTQQVLEQDLQRVRKSLGSLHRVEPVDLIARPVDLEGALAAEAVLRPARHCELLSSQPSCRPGSHCPRPTRQMYLDIKILRNHQPRRS